MSLQVFYLMATVRYTGGCATARTSSDVRGYAQIFVKAEDDLEAGAIGHDLCRERGLEFGDYLNLPTAATVADFTSKDQIEGYKRAEETGEALLFSHFLDRE